MLHGAPQGAWWLLGEYLGHSGGLIGDKRAGVTFGEIVKGVIGAGSLVCQRIAAHSLILSAVKDGAQRVIRFATGEITKRSRMDADSLIAELRRHGVTQLAEADEEELCGHLDYGWRAGRCSCLAYLKGSRGRA